MSKVDTILSAAARRDKAQRAPGHALRLVLLAICGVLALIIILSQPQVVSWLENTFGVAGG